MRLNFWMCLLGVSLCLSCKKIPETGFCGVVLSGKGRCDVIYEEGFGRDYEKFNGTVYFLPFSKLQSLPIKTAALLAPEGIAIKVQNGNVCTELAPGIYVLMLENYYSPEPDKIIKVTEGELVKENISFWECE
jgi:hypothetical protein